MVYPFRRCLALVSLTLIYALAANAAQHEEPLVDCVGSTPMRVLESEQYSDYALLPKHKFRTVETGVLNTHKVTLTSTRCTRDIRSFAFEYPKDHPLAERAYWVREGITALESLKVKPLFVRLIRKMVVALRPLAKNAHAAVPLAKDGTRWEKPIDVVVRENFDSVRIDAQTVGEKVVLTVTDDMGM